MRGHMIDISSEVLPYSFWRNITGGMAPLPLLVETHKSKFAKNRDPGQGQGPKRAGGGGNPHFLPEGGINTKFQHNG